MKRNRPFRSFAFFLALAFFACAFSGCTGGENRYEVTYLSLFDTVITIILYAPDEAAAQAEFQRIYSDLARYDALFDIYGEHPNVTNLKTLNDTAALAPVQVEQALFDLLRFGKEAYEATGGRVNIAMGSVLSLWHEARSAGIEDPEHAALPDMDALREAAAHTDIDDIILDESAKTVYFADPMLKLDVGAVGKGFAAELAAQSAKERGVSRMLLNLGGNVCALGEKEAGEPWRINVQDPDDAAGVLTTLALRDASLVTSGGYQRYYTVGGKQYHHIIDPDTLMPAEYVKAVTVTHANSGWADALSTALFNLPYEEGRALAERVGAGAVWELNDGSIKWLGISPETEGSS
ncbi:MAG: FAD:protein FMN transferase [Clostridiales bacterium]|nr:FAD:protein FMN transferase [Clostridiales bacterium]